MLKLYIQDDEGKTTVVPVIRDEITIGRQEGNTIRLTERNVSRQHARLTHADGHVYIEDVQARYGIRLNGDRVGGRTQVETGDVIQIGDYMLALHTEETAPAAGDTQDLPAVEAAPSPAAAAVTRQAVGTAADGSTSIINLDDLGEIDGLGETRDIPADQQARLVALTTKLAGREYVLNRSPMQVGRTEESDIQVDHRSISRNHAMFAWEQGTYTVRDMESANGVKVNGEFYKKADLHPGDEIEFGHVTLRFVGPGEAFAVAGAGGLIDSADSGEIPVGDVGGSPIGKIAALATLVIGAVAGVLWFSMQGRPKAPPMDPATATSTATGGGEATPDRPARALPRTTSPAVRPGTEPGRPATSPSATGPDAAKVTPGVPKPAPATPPTAPAVGVKPAVPGTAPVGPGTPPTNPQPVAAKPETAPAKPEVKAPAKPEVTAPVKPEVKAPATPEVKSPLAVAPVDTALANAKALSAQAQAKLDAGDFAASRDLASQALKAKPGYEPAEKLFETSKAELEASTRLAAARKALAGGDPAKGYNEAYRGLKGLQKTSASYAGLLEVKAKAGGEWADKLVASAARHEAAGRTAQAIGEFKKAGRVDPGNAKARAGITRLGQVKKDAKAELAQALLDEGQRLLGANKCKEAVTKLKAAVKAGSKPARAALSKAKKCAAAAKTPAVTGPADAGNKRALADKALSDGLTLKRSGNMTAAIGKFKECLSLAGLSECRAQLAIGLTLRGAACAAYREMKRYLRTGGKHAPRFKVFVEDNKQNCEK